MLLAFFYGLAAAAAALLVEVFGLSLLGMAASPVLPALTLGMAAFAEEAMKLIFLLQLGRRSTQPVGVPAATALGSGFAAIELGLFVFGRGPLLGGGPAIAIASITLVHIACALLLYAGLRFREDWRLAPFVALLSAVALHSAYNLSL
jgi:hypothetical protein